MTLADLAAACVPPTTPQTIGRIETGTRTLSTKWMERIAKGLGVEPELLVRGADSEAVQVVAALNERGPEALASPRDALAPTALGGGGRLMVMQIDYPHGEYRPGDQLWLREIALEDAGRAVNRDVLVPRKAGRFAFGRLIDRQGDKVGLLPPGHGTKQQIIDAPGWIGVAEMLVRRL